MKCGKKHCTEPGHICGLCARNDYEGQLMPAECHKCGIEACGFDPRFPKIEKREGLENG